MSELQEKKESLLNITQQIDEQERELKETIANKERNQQAIEMCEIKLDRAERLLSGLGGEATRWSAILGQLNDNAE